MQSEKKKIKKYMYTAEYSSIGVTHSTHTQRYKCIFIHFDIIRMKLQDLLYLILESLFAYFMSSFFPNFSLLTAHLG